MKNRNRLRIIFLVIASLTIRNLSFSQIEELGKFLAAGEEDAKALIQPYITPAVNAFGASLSGGWYNTAAAHKFGGFDLTLTSNIAIVPQKYETFVIENNLQNLQLQSEADNITPSVSGNNEEGPQLMYKLGDLTGPAFRMPGGLNTNYVPTPMIQAGIGLIKGTEVIVRYLPDINSRGNQIGLWGIGGKHDIKQWIPGLKTLPVLGLSIMYGYTDLHTTVNINVTPGNINAAGMPGATSSDWENQELKLETKSQTGNLVASANFTIICLYGGVGFVTTNTTLKLEGDYPTVYLDDNGIPTVKAFTDPINMVIKNQDGSFTKPRFNAGVRFKFAVVTIHFDYSWANYSVVTGGLGISFR